MRWVYFDGNDSDEAAFHADTLLGEDGRLVASVCREDAHDLEDLFKRQVQKWDLPAWMNRHLQAIDSSLMWEYGPACSAAGAPTRHHARVPNAPSPDG